MPNIRCHQCKTILEITPDLVDQQLICPSCSWQFIVHSKSTQTSRARFRSKTVRAIPHPIEAQGAIDTSEECDPTLPRSEPLPRQSREYIHSRCGREAQFDGNRFERVANPFNGIRRTYCEPCRSVFPLEEFVWKDSQEKIADYRARLLANASHGTKRLCHALRHGPSIASGVGIGGGCISGIFWGWEIGTSIAIVFASLAFLATTSLRSWLIQKQIVPKNLGVQDCRQLR